MSFCPCVKLLVNTYPLKCYKCNITSTQVRVTDENGISGIKQERNQYVTITIGTRAPQIYKASYTGQYYENRYGVYLYLYNVSLLVGELFSLHVLYILCNRSLLITVSMIYFFSHLKHTKYSFFFIVLILSCFYIPALVVLLLIHSGIFYRVKV